MSSRKKRTRANRPSGDQAELSALLQQSSPVLASPAPSTGATYSLDDLSTAVSFWGDDAEDRRAAKVSGGFGPNACLAIEVLTVMTLTREQLVTCPHDSALAVTVGTALRAMAKRLEGAEASPNAHA
jgi:hypothetical protein